MLKRHLLISVIMALAALTWACGGTPFHKDSTLNKNWGRSYETAKYNQILNPEAAKNLEPVTGLDGQPSDYNVNKYKESFKKTEPREVVNILKLQ
jgi:hypothetical protein